MKTSHVIFVIGTVALFLGATWHPTQGDVSEDTSLGTLTCHVIHPDGQVTLFQRSLPLLGILFLISLFEKLRAQPEQIPRLMGLLELLNVIPGEMNRDFNVRVFSYGQGDIYVPTFDETNRMNGFLGMMIKPIIYKYGLRGVTLVWQKKFLPPAKSFWGKLGRQQGIVIGFRGLNIQLHHDSITDTHLMVGKTLVILHQDFLF